MVRGQVIIPEGLEDMHKKFRYSPALKVGNTLYISGQVGRGKGHQVIEDREAQHVQAFENLRTVLGAAGASLEDLVELVSYHTDIRDLYSVVVAVKDRYLTKPPYPTWTGIGTTALAAPGMVVELKCTAVLNREREVIVPKELEVAHESFHYSPAVKVGDTLYVSGQVGRDAKLNVVEGREAQYIQAFENLNAVLAAAGATFRDVVDLVSYHTDIADLPLFMEVKDRYFTDDYPAWTGVGTTALAMPGLFLELHCTAVIGSSREFIVPSEMEAVCERLRCSAGVRVNGTVYLSGQMGLDENLRPIEHKESQYIRAFENLGNILEEVGGTFDDLVELTTFHTDIRDEFSVCLSVKNQYFTNRYPTWTAIGTPALCGLCGVGPAVALKCKAVVSD
jgi:enamine deaminase RidA (YjgF/YER057c/UK114 family)